MNTKERQMWLACAVLFMNRNRLTAEEVESAFREHAPDCTPEECLEYGKRFLDEAEQGGKWLAQFPDELKDKAFDMYDGGMTMEAVTRALL